MAKTQKTPHPHELVSKANEIKFFSKHIVEGKKFTQCVKEMHLSEQTLSQYKKRESFRDMALAFLDDSSLKGLSGTMCKLVDALDAKKPHNIETTKKDGSKTTEVIWVADVATQMKALQELNKIYGIYAPQHKNVTVEISLSSDAELFEQIDEVTRSRKYVDSYVRGEGGFELAPDPQERVVGDFDSRKRALLQDVAIP